LVTTQKTTTKDEIERARMPSHVQNNHYYPEEDACYELFEIRGKEVSASVLEVPPLCHQVQGRGLFRFDARIHARACVPYLFVSLMHMIVLSLFLSAEQVISKSDSSRGHDP
jgi:hypothetical protein